MKKLTRPTWLYVPLCTPMYKWTFDKRSFKKLIQTLEPHVDGYVPCLSSWEWHEMSVDLRKSVLSETLKLTQKPVYVWIKRDTTKEVIALLRLAEELWATWITTPVLAPDQTDIYEYIQTLASETFLPIIIYNTEQQHIDNIELLQKIDALKSIVAIKDSSMNDVFFEQMIAAKQKWDLDMSVFQWMEHKLKTSLDADWFLISLANVEPELCKMFLQHGWEELFAVFDEIFRTNNLWKNWYVTLKAMLMMKWIFSSAEEVNPFITP